MVKMPKIFCQIFFALLSALTIFGCNKSDDTRMEFKNEKVSRFSYEKIQPGMSIAEVEAILGKPGFGDSRGNKQGQAAALPHIEKEMSLQWCHDWRDCEKAIYCVFRDTGLVKKEFKQP